MDALAKKAIPFDSIVTADWRKLCLGELQGARIINYPRPNKRHAIVDGGHNVRLQSGGHAGVINQQPEADALLRWQTGVWTESDIQYAEEWRKLSKSFDLVHFKRRFGPARQPAESFEQLKSIVDRVLKDPSLQCFLLRLLMEEVSTDRQMQRAILQRWSGSKSLSWQERSPLSKHCIKTLLTFYIALGSNLIGTHPTNRVDIEYLLYLPFASAFVSGNEGTHGKLAPLLIDSDQRFIRASEFRNALQEEADRLDHNKARITQTDQESQSPPDSSLLANLYADIAKTRLLPRNQNTVNLGADPQINQATTEFFEAAKQVENNPDVYKQRPPWPHIT